ncbi:pirin family protein [Corynebacterium testudinoris]|uniref:Pirin-related protein n=1 Tax=Corynebacterium testudinoris TaxID=136857 RepID=A0A0G3H2F8_9CORY|nr:pirin family protein [Corynebacterium testudinoris]AKK07594.1 Pirin-related protein [Corynebacterium testudinoris]MBX8996120.1 pirin family protein [Corynebacterium testudinoris]
MSTMTVIRSTERGHWRDSAIVSRQSFPATGNFDLAANSFGLLMVFNDDIVAPGEGFDMHQHDNVEIVSWIAEGALRHRDSGSTDTTVLHTGSAQLISAGSGVSHSEVNAAGYTSRQKVRVVQSWLATDEHNTEPFHATYDASADLASGELVQIAGPDSPLPIKSSQAILWAARPRRRATLSLPQARYLHIYVVAGSLELEGHRLTEGDAARLTDSPATTATAEEDSEILIWAMDRAIKPA